MSFVESSHSLEKIKKEFDELLNNLALVLEDMGSKTHILNTKLGHIKKDLDNVEFLNCREQIKLLEIAIKYNQVNHIFKNDISFNKKDLLKIIKGKHEYGLDSDAQYNDFIFEVSMATRFILSLGDAAEINLDGICDVLVDDLAIECKYIHSRKNMVQNIKKAKKQVEKRVSNGQAKSGLIALDLSHLFPVDKVNDFVNTVFELFAANHEVTVPKQGIYGSVVEAVIADSNFRNIIQSYTMHEVENSLYSELMVDYDMGQSVLGIVFQSSNTFFVEYNGQFIPVPTRGLTYNLNSRLSKKSYLKVEEFIHKLAVGL